jgi:hypothetical protein
MKKSKFDWGQYLCPSKSAVKDLGLDPASFGIGFGKTGKTRGESGLLVIRDGHKTLETYSPDYWEVLLGTN